MIISIPGIVSQGGGIFLPQKGIALNDCSWAEISMISQAGLASEYFSTGDRKAVDISGKVGTLTLSGTYYCFIIGINHNSNLEGNNLTHFQFGYQNENDAYSRCFADSKYNSSTVSGSYFIMDRFSSVGSGWESSFMRGSICYQFKQALPSDLQAAIRPVIKYTDNVGDGTTATSNVTATEDEIFLLAPYEVNADASTVNSGEPSMQQQYAWYAENSSAKNKRRYGETGEYVNWWSRSPRLAAAKKYNMFSNDSDGWVSKNTIISSGFAPCFCV